MALRLGLGLLYFGMARFDLRVATREDVAGIRRLIDASVRGLQAGDYSAPQIEGALATVFTVDSQLIADGTYLVALTEGGELAGCGGWSFRKTLYGGDHQIEKIAPERLDPAVDAAKVRAIFVHPKFARMGLGSLTLSAGGACRGGVGIFAIRDGEYVDRRCTLYVEGVSGRPVGYCSGGWWGED